MCSIDVIGIIKYASEVYMQNVVDGKVKRREILLMDHNKHDVRAVII